MFFTPKRKGTVHEPAAALLFPENCGTEELYKSFGSIDDLTVKPESLHGESGRRTWHSPFH